MTLSELSIRRPVLATVFNLLIVVVGIAAFRELPVREYPDIDIPVVSISTVYFGALFETVENTITEPLEQVLGGVDEICLIIFMGVFRVVRLMLSLMLDVISMLLLMMF